MKKFFIFISLNILILNNIYAQEIKYIKPVKLDIIKIVTSYYTENNDGTGKAEIYFNEDNQIKKITLDYHYWYNEKGKICNKENGFDITPEPITFYINNYMLICSYVSVHMIFNGDDGTIDMNQIIMDPLFKLKTKYKDLIILYKFSE